MCVSIVNCSGYLVGFALRCLLCCLVSPLVSLDVYVTWYSIDRDRCPVLAELPGPLDNAPRQPLSWSKGGLL